MSTLKVNSVIPVAGVPTGGGGGIIQTVQAIKKDTASFTISPSTTYDYTGLQASITPIFSTSKILITGFITLSSDALPTTISIMRGGSLITDLAADANGNQVRGHSTDHIRNDSSAAVSIHGCGLDSPNSTSQQTYNYRINHTSGSDRTYNINRTQGDQDSAELSRYVSVTILQEVSA